MKFRHLSAGGLLLMALFVVPLLVVPPVLAQDAWVSSGPADVSAAAIEEYWTVERMRNALPYPMHSPEGPATAVIPTGSVPNQADGEPGVRSAGLPGMDSSLSDSSAAELALLLEGEAGDTIQPEAAWSFPFPFTMYEVKNSDRWRYPYGAIGRIWFVTSSGFNSSCSGSSIGGRAVLTAGHCVSDGSGGWHRNWIFRPGYKDFGTWENSNKTWTGTQAWTFTAWHTGGSYCRDVGLFTVADKAGEKLSEYVGWLGYAWNWDAEVMQWAQFGYSAERSRTTPEYFFDGGVCWENHASFAEWTASWWTPAYDCTPLPYCIGSYMTGGSSGGPVVWMWDPGFGIYPGAGNYANGVNSTYYLSGRVAGGMCTPYFDTAVADFIDYVTTF